MKIRFLLLCLVFSSLHAKWSVDQIQGKTKEHSLSLMQYEDASSPHLIFEFMQSQKGLQAFLHLTRGYAKAHPKIDHLSVVNLHIDGEVITINPTKLSGDQTLIFNNKTTQMMVAALREGKNIGCFFEGGHIEIKSKGFEKKFTKFVKYHKKFSWPRFYFEWPQ